MLDLVLLAALLHELDSLGARELEDGELEVLLGDLLHLRLDGGKVVLADFLFAKVHVIVETVVGGGAIGEVGLGIQALDGLGHDVGGGVADNVGDLICRALDDGTVIVQDLHENLFLRIIWRSNSNFENKKSPRRMWPRASNGACHATQSRFEGADAYIV